MSDDRREIFERLEALERRLGGGDERHGHRRHRRHDCGHDHGHGHHHHHDDHRHHDRHHHHDEDEGFDEKRVIDTIVGLVTEHVGKVVREQARSRQDGEEKRLVDLVVGLIGEHVREIVVTELDRRFGPAPDVDDEGGDDEPPADEPGPEQR
jgi:hypothetical protein